ncbi:MAG TPA: 2-C-methyl-D-erythritol 2,4-cyclodiphosphate synthase [Candidatus Hydrogenedens sp.]|nr:2-C-methyl-D-erythritol 2,4-cyclodiphosphate synthase [Candidatus Hydrogenedens sp.]HOL18675.1 2-C-methyl-D-erythritol 2,4-cyclodiphosphate synthase [Candidatus Hydrogenedens sp.]HPP58528.1 2-C-methyl-D-erythritol 2,4-cyclodiphosphate synthase [Candidatus Hydrogenedens sp.]
MTNHNFIHRIGIGYDLHRLTEGRPLIIGGVTISHHKGLQGHSDADVLIHAIIDAILGALALGDIGTYFPDTDPKYKNIDSKILLKQTVQVLQQNGWKIVNLDTTIIAEQPKLKPYIKSMRDVLSQLLQIPLECTSVKAKTNEGVGPEGKEEAISAFAVVLISQKS